MSVEDLRIGNSRVAADLADAELELTLDCSTGQVSQLTLTILDTAGVLVDSSLTVAGTDVTWADDPWQVGGFKTSWPDDNTVRHTITCRSRLGRLLRKQFKASVEKKVSPSDWVIRRVTALGGTAICQASAQKGTIAQTSGDQKQSELDVIANLAGELGWAWTERGNVLLFGSRYWAWQGGLQGQRTWLVTRGKDPASDALAAELGVDDDDTENFGTGTLTVPYLAGRRMRAWDLIQVTGRGARNGIWLLENVQKATDGWTGVELTVAQPRQPQTKKGSSK